MTVWFLVVYLLQGGHVREMWTVPGFTLKSACHVAGERAVGMDPDRLAYDCWPSDDGRTP